MDPMTALTHLHLVREKPNIGEVKSGELYRTLEVVMKTAKEAYEKREEEFKIAKAINQNAQKKTTKYNEVDE